MKDKAVPVLVLPAATDDFFKLMYHDIMLPNLHTAAVSGGPLWYPWHKIFRFSSG